MNGDYMTILIDLIRYGEGRKAWAYVRLGRAALAQVGYRQ
jgi:hypothetical protein